MVDRETIIFLLKQPAKNVINRFITLIADQLKFLFNIKSYNTDFVSDDFLYPEITHSFIDVKSIDISGLDEKLAGYLIEMYLDHRFDLLGSGWIHYSYRAKPLGVEGVKYDISGFCFLPKEKTIDHLVPGFYTPKAKILWSQLDKDYAPIDWQRDYKSGYRWDASKQNKLQRLNIPDGADLKMPWELSRMQFLPQLAVFSLVHSERKEKIIREFKNIVLDFVATNPLNYGVNWVCAMDVAIRAVNILIAFDILKQVDKEGILSGDFISVLQRSIFEHGLFIVNNLEYSHIITSNHYLADICGLLFIASYLGECEYTNTWLIFSTQGILREIPKQFYADGGNFEASTSYHRLSSEMVIYSYALLKRICKVKPDVFQQPSMVKWKHIPRISIKNIPTLFSRLTNKNLEELIFKTGLFLQNTIKPTGELPQIGDNDSGRFIKFSPVGEFISNREAEEKYYNLLGYNYIEEDEENLYFDENQLNTEALLSAYSGLFKAEELNSYRDKFPLEASIVSSISGNTRVELPQIKQNQIDSFYKITGHWDWAKNYTIHISNPIDIDNLKPVIYPEFGIVVYKSLKDDFYLSVFFGQNGQNGLGGHSHNDKLSFELYHLGENLYADPGSYLYTPFPEIRNKFRSVFMHNAPIHGNKEQDIIRLGRKYVFRLYSKHKCFVMNFKPDEFSVYLKYRKVRHVRNFRIFQNHIEIHDFCNKKFEQNIRNIIQYSPGYGKLIKF